MRSTSVFPTGFPQPVKKVLVVLLTMEWMFPVGVKWVWPDGDSFR
jgi:hypothetical protein